LTSEGTLAQLSCLDSHVQNGVTERKHRHVIGTARTLLISSFVPSHFWSEAVSTAVYLINMQPSSKLFGKCLGEVLFGTPSRYDHLRVFGCTCYVLLSSRERIKLTAQSVECVFLGYSPEHKGYRCYDPSSRRIRISRDVSFVENPPFFYNPSTHASYSPTESTSFMCLPPIQDPPFKPPPSTLSTPTILIPITSPNHMTPPSHTFSKPPITQTYTRRPRTITMTSPEEPVDDRTNINESHTLPDQLQVPQGYNLRDCATMPPIDRLVLAIAEPSNY
jgi:hypothetical protein